MTQAMPQNSWPMQEIRITISAAVADSALSSTASDPPAPYGLIARHGILGERFADVLTDALRAALLRQHGYRVEVIQFVESRHTPRNTMVRAVRTGAAPSAEVEAEYDALVGEWGVRPALAVLLDRA